MSALRCRFWLLVSTIALWIVGLGAKEIRIVCYYTNWSVYRPGDAKFNPQNINPYLCTHLIYAFGGFTKENTLKPFDKYQDVEKGGYAKFVGLKTYNKNLKTMLAIGGWNEGSTRFSPMVASAERRKELVKNTIKFLRQNHFDGLDLDWEYPSFRDGGKPRDRGNYARLVQEMREEFDRESEKTGRPRLLLTMAVPAGIEYINKGYDIPKLNEYLDWMNILSYDYHSAYEPAVNHHSPLYPVEEENEYSLDIDLNVDYTIKHYLENGADKSKLVLGIPTYGRSYTLYNPDANEIGSPADGPGEMGDATRENGYLAFYEICEKLKSDDWEIESPYPDAMGPYAYNNDQWVGYDDEDIARKKAEYVAKNGLGGIMFWSIDNDDFRGKCGERPYPIIEAAKEALLKAYGLTDANLLATTKKPIKTRTKTRGTTRTATATTEAPSTVRSRPNSRRKNVNRVNGDEVKPGAKRRISGRRNKKKPESTTSVSSLVVTPSYTTPAPPSTPDSGGDFKCEDEGFFPHPKDCKKYFWCLSGPSELGIVAHQFTCPAGLYFNKAAASCDYTQNVLCNKKLTKTATTTTTTTSLPPTSSFSSTRRPPPKITAATSRTTVTTTEPPEEEDEYEEYDDDVEEAAKESGKDAEQDPKVIKDLIELIKKAGGIEELEKQLQISVGSGGSESSIVDATTRSSINKSLYEKVLGRATATLNEEKKKTVFKTYNTIGRNSRGPQNEGLEQSRETPSRGRLQYTSIVRSRPSTEAFDVKPVYEEDQEEENVERPAVFRPPYKKNQLEYVTIRRQRITTTTETSEADNPESQFKQLGESEVPNEEGDSRFRSSTMPSPYVTIRRSRPTAEPSENNETPQSESNADNSTQPPEYVTLKRQGPNAVEQNTTTSRYFEIPDRGTTTPAPIQTTSTSEEIKEEKPSITIDESANSVEENIVENTDSNVTEQSVSTNSNNSNDTLRDVVDNIKEIINSQKQEEQNGKIPVLSDPRPFSLNSRIRSSTTTEEIPKDVKVSVSSPRNVLRNKILEARIPPSSKNVNNQELNTDDEKNNDVLEDDEKPNRFSARHRFSTETSKDESQVIRIRGRGQSRFTAQTVATTTIRNRPIAKITETPYTDYETIEYNRKYRPDIVAEISDLSSLLAVDFKDLQSRRKPGRRRRPVIQTTTASSVTTEASSTTTELDENQKNGSKTVPLARKLLDGALFGRANKFRSTTTASPITTKTTSTTETQPKNEEVSERPIKTFRKPIAKTPNFFDGSRLNRFRKASINTTAETVSSTPPTIRSFPTRRRVVLRKLIKPISRTISTTTSATTSTTASTTPIITSTTTQITTTTTTTEKEEPTATTENQTSLPAENQTTSIPENQQVTLLTENQETLLIEDQNATKENEEVAADKQKPTTTTTEKENTTLPNEVLETTFSSREKDEIDDDKSEEADDNEEGENIKLSESIVRENSQNFGNIIREGLKPGKLSEDKSFKSAGKDIIFDERPSTEPSFFVRTRKIIRKLSTTESPILSTESDGPKFKKVVRRLKLTTASGNNLNGDEKPVEASTTSLLHKGRRRFGITPTGIDYVEGENDEENERKKYGFRRPTTPNGEDDYEKEEFGIRKKIEAEKSPDDQTFKSIKPTFKLNRPLFRRRKIGTASKPDEKRSENEEIRPLFGRRKYGSSTFRPIQDESKILNINKALYNRRIPTFTVYSTTSTPTPSSTAESTISNETENDSTITTEAATETAEETKTEPTSDEKIETVSTESASNDRTEIISSTPTSEESTLEDLTTVDGNKEIETMVKANTTAIPGNEETTEQATLKPSNESSTLNYTSTRYGEVSNTTSLPLSTRRGKLYFKNKTYGTNSNALGNGEEDRQVKKLISTTESALSKLLRKRKGYNKITTQEETKQREEIQKAIENKEEAKEKEEQEERAKEDKEVFKRRKGYNKGIALQENIKSITEEEDGEAKEKEGQEQRTKEKEEKEEEQDWKTEEYTTTSGGNQTESDVSKEHSTTTANINGEEESTLITEATTMLQDETERAIEEFATTIEDLLTKIDSSTEMEELATKIEDLSTETEDFSTNTDYVSTKTEELSTTEDLPTITTDPTKEETITTTTEYVSTTTTTRKPSRLFRPIALRPKFTGRFKPSELSTTLTPTISSTERFKPNKFNKFAKLKPTPKRFTSSSTTENEDLGYGPIKEIKSAFRPNLYHPRNKFTPEKEQVNEEVVGEQEEEEIDSDDYVEEDTTEVGEKQHPRPSLFSKPGYKPSYIILKPSSNADEEIAGEHEEGPNQEEKTEGDTEDKTVSSANPSNVYFSSTSKPSTRQYKKFTTASPATVAQNLSDVNITAVNQRNRNLFNKTRKMNTPFVGVTSKVETNKTTDNSYLLSLLTSTKQDDATEKVTTTTERATTLHHIFAESDNPDETTLIYNPIDETTEKKVEKIIEINRIVKVTAKVKNGANVIETETDDKPEKVDRLLVSRVTEIKVVEGENGTHRQEKKYETRAKNDNDVITSAKKMSSKPFYSVETATIPLEGLFQTSPPKVDLQNELLEGENSNYVNVRVLQQDSPNKLSRMATNAKFVPVRLLKDEDEITMKADVVEVTPSASNQQIKIVPISVSIQTT